MRGLTTKERGAAAVASSRLRRGNGLVLGLLPLLILGAVCAFGVLQRQIAARAGAGRSYGHMTQADAQRVASEVYQKMIGGDTSSSPALVQASTERAYSRRRKTFVHEWNVVCGTSEGEYLFRINADTGRVYAVNQLTADEEVAGANPDGPPLTRSQAEAMARHYLRVVGVPIKGLTASVDMLPNHKAHIGPQWHFTFHRQMPGYGDRLIKVSVSSKDGGLEDIWNPVWAL